MPKHPKCINYNKAFEACATKGCRITNPFICENCSNNQCYQRHKECRKSRYPDYIKRIESTRPERTQKVIDYIEKMEQVIDQSICLLQKEKQKFKIWEDRLGLSLNLAQFYDRLDRGDEDEMTGDYLFSLTRDLTTPKYHSYITLYDQNTIKRGIEQASLQAKALAQRIQSLYKNNYEIIQQKIEEIKIPYVQPEVKVLTKLEIFKKQNPLVLNFIKNEIQGNELDLRGKLENPHYTLFLADIQARELTKLGLNDNKLQFLEPLIGLRFPNLRILCLDYNNIKSIQPLKRVKFPNLQYLYLQYNQIEDIKPLVECGFAYLKILHLNYNQIKTVEPLILCNFKKLKELNIYDNNITQLSPLLRIDFPELQFLNLYANKYRPQQIAKYKPLLTEKFPKTYIKFYT